MREVKAPLTTIAENWESTVSLDPERTLPKLEAMEGGGGDTNNEEEEEDEESSSGSESGTESGSGSSSTSCSSLESSSSSYEEDHNKVRIHRYRQCCGSGSGIRDPVLFLPPGSGIRDGAMVGSGSGIRD
jgi:hypothetical protein